MPAAKAEMRVAAVGLWQEWADAKEVLEVFQQEALVFIPSHRRDRGHKRR